jgi:ketosteroid isomerase-like protein
MKINLYSLSAATFTVMITIANAALTQQHTSWHDENSSPGAAATASVPSVGEADSPNDADADDEPLQPPAGDTATVAALHREWILVGWEKKPGDGPLNFREKLGKYYNWSAPDVILYDDFEPKRRVAHSAAEYGSFWEPPFTALRSARHRVVDGPHVLVSGNLAASTLQFAARLEGGDGKVTGIRTFTSLAWRKGGDGWKIIREHNSSTVLSPAQLEELMSTSAKR